jgi:hypothetical protein
MPRAREDYRSPDRFNHTGICDPVTPMRNPKRVVHG